MVVANNPVLRGFYPDPSICRVGKDFYLANSSFLYFPGVPLFHSRDLAHWEQVGNILDRQEQLQVDEGMEEISRGIFAPTIRYHNGRFYMITTNVSHGDNFIVTAERPEGPWSQPYYLGDEAPGIDPSLFFDEDGRCYYVGTRPNPDGVRYNGDWEIWIQELDTDRMVLIGESCAIWKGALKNAIWPEGPHIYKLGEYYYLVHAEGGTGPAHSICVARSKQLFGGFEGCPNNPVFTHRHLGKNYPVIYAGHCDLVDDENGNWYAVMLASRPCNMHSSMGRETFLAKVTWEDGWPVFNAGVGKLEDFVEVPLEEFRFDKEITNCDLFHFWEDKLDDRLLGIVRRDPDRYSLKDRKGFLRLHMTPDAITKEGSPCFLGVRQKSYHFCAGCGMEYMPEIDQEAAGMVLFQNHENNLRMEVVKSSKGRSFRVITHIHGSDEVVAEMPLEKDGLIEIQLKAENQSAAIYAGESGKLKKVTTVSLLPYTTEEAGGFVGCTVGMYASSNNFESSNFADFAWFSVDNQ